MKLVISDADGTLLCNEKFVDERAFARMLRTLSPRGIPTVIASGRTHAELKRLFIPYEKNILYIPLDGSLAVAGETLLCGFPLQGESLTDIRSLLCDRGVRGILFCTKDAVWCASDDDALSKREDARLCGELRHLSFDRYDPATPILPNEPIYKVCVYTKRGYKITRKPHAVRATYESPCLTEYVREDVSKWSALQVLCEGLHISPADAIAYGDSGNDREMLTGVRDAGGRAVTIYGAIHDIFSITPYHTKNVAESVLFFLSEDDKKEAAIAAERKRSKC